ncbi:MAG: 50S ribosomal protein L4 [Clostridia bacterium]|jgi:large subunit ribosomal protein L4|nr:50S ribosomal protein L4 [Clostridia bacterium]MBR0454044.1 50S ribosomal protein L4 [Clostridia bacterium]
MPNIKVFDMTGKEVGEMTLSERVFGAEVNAAVLHAAVRTYLMNQRQGTQSTLTRTEVSGGGKKPWRQKGTGRARQGSTRAPQWTHGGVALGPKPRDYRISMNKKAKKVAIRSALSAKVAAGELIVVDNITLDAFKTAEMVKMLKALGCQKEVTKNYKVTTVTDGQVVREKKTRTAVVAQKALVVLPEVNKFVVKSCANIPGVVTTLSSTINVYEVLNAEKVVMTRAAVEKLEEVYA